MSDSNGSSTLDDFLDFVTIELLGCAMPRTKRAPAVIEQPRRDPATTWSNGWTAEQSRVPEQQLVVPQLETEQPLRSSTSAW